MAKAEKSAQPAAVSTNRGGGCLAEGCSKNAERAEFCTEHFRWFKLGLITRTGARAKDFDKKFIQHGRSPTI
ncbi:MAG TPA: hypothetical protein VFV50_15620 [Bdellovibrionales bacterium]|nr:hypothetical protein [Bdellovibrionales bacterium]